MKYLLTISVVLLMAIQSCEKENPTDETKLTEWGQSVKDKIDDLKVNISDLAFLKVYNADESEQYFSGFGTPEEGTPNLFWTPMELSLVAEYHVYEDADWNISWAEIPYNEVIGIIIQYIDFIEGGRVVRSAHNILLYMSNDYVVEVHMDGMPASALMVEGMEIVRQEVFLKD